MSSPSVLSRELPRELVLASAGTGKTFRVSSRIIGLLELGAEPEDIFASTFTRKAAGEILERVLERLARAGLDDEAASELSKHALLRPTGGPRSHGVGPRPDRREWQAVLARLVDGLHRVNVSTLDAFFVRIAGGFAFEMGFSPRWSIGDEPTSARLESEALEDVLESADRHEMLELIRALLGGEATRSVHERILGRARDLRWVLHQVDPRVERPWRPFEEEADPPDDEERERVAARIEALDPPTNKDGSPNKSWAGALEDAAEAAREGRWDDLLEKGVGAKVLAGEGEYGRKAISPPVEAAFRDALGVARRAVRFDVARRAGALGILAERFDEALDRRQRREGAYRFDDITRRLGGMDPVVGRADLWYRLDQRARHLLLDEFQDTSLSQWEALRPLAEELLSGHAEDRAAVIVADPKQSIYGWRGAEPELVHRVRRSFVLDEDRLHRSYRSSATVLSFVNRIFGDMGELPLWDGVEEDRTLVRSWLLDFEPHEAARNHPGRVRVEVGPREDRMRSDDRPLMMRRAAERIADIRRRAPGYSVGVLLRKNRNVPLLIAELRARGIDASEEGGSHLNDSPAVAAVLALLRMTDHPGHSIARYHVARSPLGPLVGLDAHDDDFAARETSRSVRRRLLRDGYGPTLDAWTRTLGSGDTLGSRDLRRLYQLVELGFEWDEGGATLRPGDFVRFVEQEKVEDPTTAAVRVMTVHQAKGLEFDVVVLPELDLDLTGGGAGVPTALPERDPGTGRIVRVFPYVKSAARPFVPEVTAAAVQDRASALRDALGILYVAMTRARFALHLLVAADSDRGPSSSTTYARLVREAIGAFDDAVSDGDVLLDTGDGSWPERVPPEQRRRGEKAEALEPVELRPGLAAPGERRRTLSHRSPSELKEGSTIQLGELLALDEEGSRGAARQRGIVVHEWCRAVGWIEDGIPEAGDLLSRARRVAPEMPRDEMERLAREFLGWLDAPEVRRSLSKESTTESEPGGPGGGMRLEREWPFAVRRGDEIVRGIVDRLVLFHDGGGRVVRAHILDYKTDRAEAARDGTGSGVSAEGGEQPTRDGGESGEHRQERGPEGRSIRKLVDRYAPQIEAYRHAVSRAHDVDPQKIDAHLVFLRSGDVEEVLPERR